MPRRTQGPHLWWRKERRKDGKIVAKGVWIIVDGGNHHATGCFAGENREAQERLAAYIADKYRANRRVKDIEDIDLADVLALYDEDCRERQANKAKFDERMARLARWWGGKMLSAVTGATCRAFTKHRGNNGGSRRDLEDLRAAINHHSKEGFHRGIVRVVLPSKGLPRERWLSRDEAAALLWACWRYREQQPAQKNNLTGKKIETDKRPLRHVARFILIGLYTGTRAGAIATASTIQKEGRSFVDLDNGIFYRLAQGKRATNKRQTPVPLPSRLLAHLRRWSRLGISKNYFVEWRGKPVASVKTGFGSAVRIAGLSAGTGNVTPHTLRHTAATWLMQRAAPMWEAAGFLGMSEKTLRDTYGHHHQDHLRGAADAISSRPIPTKQKLVVSLVEEKAKRQAAAEAIEIIGGPGRTRTCNQTVMSGRL